MISTGSKATVDRLQLPAKTQPMDEADFLASAGLVAAKAADEVIVLDLHDLAVVGMATTRMLAEGRSVTPEMLPALLDRDQY
jgi:hypothetical protein